ncbi:hypothetical protein CRYUN_Cryun12cG0134800 [Craigia yunnanensis]
MLQSIIVWSCYGAGPFNYKGNEHATFVNRPIERVEAGQPGNVLNPNPLSTELRLSYEEDELNSSVSSVNGNMTTFLPVKLSFRDNLKAEIDRQKEEFDHYIRLQVIIRSWNKVPCIVRKAVGIDSEVDDAASYTNQNHLDVLDGYGNPFSMKKQINCGACKVIEVFVLLLPCRHFCLCKD